MTFAVPLSDVRLTDAQKQAVNDVLDSGWLSMGPRTEAFEHAFAKAAGVDDALCVSSATAALILALQAAGVGPGDEVVVPSLTFVADANACRVLGATPVFADVVSPDHPSVAVDDVLRAITPRTRAVIIVHYAGFVTPLSPLTVLRDDGITLVADASHAVGPLADDGAWLPAEADVTVFSFFANKNLAIGEGGMLTSPTRSCSRGLGSSGHTA